MGGGTLRALLFVFGFLCVILGVAMPALTKHSAKRWVPHHTR
jgi:hypothetical protein